MLPSATPSNVDVPSNRNRPFLVHRQAGFRRFFDHQPAVPVMPVTMIQLELLLGQAVLELDAVVELILSDLGATLQVLRVTADIRNGTDRCFSGIHNCVVHLGRKGLRRTLQRLLPSEQTNRDHDAWQLWRRARITAELSRLLAGRSTAVSPDEARMAGLLREAGRLPMILGWRVAGIDLADFRAVRRAMAREWNIPLLATSTLLPAFQWQD